MSRRPIVLLPAQGKPVTRVWLPPSRRLDDLVAVPRLSDSAADAARRKAVSLGVTPLIRLVPRPHDIEAVIWVNWVKTGEAPRGYEELSVAAALADANCGPLVRALVDALARPRY
jgi:hypothetical protein